MTSEGSCALVEILHGMLNEIHLLNELLTQESQALSDRRIDQIHFIATKKQESANRVQRQTDLQQLFFESRQIRADDQALSRYLGQLGEEDPRRDELQSCREQIETGLKQCKDLNEQNGARIELLNRHARRAIDFLRHQGNQPHTYGPDGVTQHIPISRTRTSV